MINQVTVSIIGGIIAALMALYTVANGIIMRRRERRARAAELFTSFYTGDFYRYSVLSVYRTIVKLRGLEGNARQAYLDAIVCGWIASADGKVDMAHFIPPEEQKLDPSTAHFRHQHTTGAHTEHDSLVIFLYFWVRADRLIEAGLVDVELFAKLFGNSFGYYDDFMHELAAAIRDCCGDEPEPSWIGAMERIAAHLQKHALLGA